MTTAYLVPLDAPQAIPITCDVCRESVPFDRCHIGPVDDLVTCWQCAKEDQLWRGRRFLVSLTPLPETDGRCFQSYADTLRRGLDTLTLCQDPEFWADNAEAGIEWLLTHGAKLCATWGEETVHAA